MKRRDKAGGKAVKPKRYKPMTRHNASKERSISSLAAGNQANVEPLARELEAALEQQAATSEVLKVISSSAMHLQPVFEAIARSSVALCEATYGVVYRFDGEMISVA